jgi:glutamate/tyrosine decarboxylase-like PLP-dependent enzyme
MSIKTFGLNAFRDAVDYNIELAEKVEELLRGSDKWQVVHPATLAIINFRYNPIAKDYDNATLDTINQFISEKVMVSRKALLVTTLLNKQVVLRMCLINPRTTLKDIKETLKLCEDFAREIQ